MSELTQPPFDTREPPERDGCLNVGEGVASGGVDGKYGRITVEKKVFHPDEPVFLLRATDRLAPLAIAQYAISCKEAGCSPEHVKACLDHAQAIRDWQRAHPELVKVPD